MVRQRRILALICWYCLLVFTCYNYVWKSYIKGTNETQHSQDAGRSKRILERTSHQLNRPTATSAESTNTSSSTTAPTKVDNVQVIILTQKRSGSSFIGDLFSQNPDFTYFYEPLSALTQLVLRHREKTHLFQLYANQIFEGILHRNFSNMPYYWWSGRVPINTCSSPAISSIFHLCGTSDIKTNKRSINYAEKMQLLGRAVKERQGVAVKTIRVQDLKELKDFVTNPTLNVKIIHLVRDPRGIMNERFKSKELNYDLRRRKGNSADEILDMCQHLDSNLEYRNNSADWLVKGRYKLVRYEDAVDDPIRTAMDIYEFIGLDLPQTVKKLQENTTNDLKFPENSTCTNVAWRTQLDYPKVVDVQIKCARSMASLGYLTVNSIAELEDCSIPVLAGLPVA